MTTIVTRAGKGSPLTNNEVDANFTNLNTDKVEVTGTPLGGQVVTWDSGTSKWIPAYPAGSGTVTSVNVSGDSTGLTFTGGPITTSGTITLGGTLSVAYGGTGATTASGARANLSAAVLGANGDITSLTGITGGISSPDFVQFDVTATPTAAVGQLGWNDTAGTLDLGLKGGNVVLQLGQEEVVRVTNTTGSTMVDGQAVYITGSTGSHLNVSLAQANAEITSSKTIAVITESIAHSTTGFATTSGIVRGIDTSALTEGAAVWLSPTVAGGLTSTKPQAPNHAVLIGWCVTQHATVGAIYVHVSNGWEVDELHDVKITGTPAAGSLLIRNATDGLWENATVTAGTGISITNADKSITVTNSAPDQVVSLTGAGTTAVTGTYPNFTITSNDTYTGTVTSVSGSGGTTGLTFSGSPITTSGTLTLGGTLGVANGGTGTTTQFTAGSVVFAGASGVYSQDNANLFWDDTNNRLGIGTSSPGVKLDVAGDIRSTSGNIYAANGGAYAWGNAATYISGSAATNIITAATDSVERLRIDSSGRTMIGTTSPLGMFCVDRTSASAGWVVAARTSGVSNETGVFMDASNNMEFAARNGSGTLTVRIGSSGDSYLTGGNLGVGTSSPNAKVDVQTTGAYSAYFQTAVDQASNVAARRISLTAINFRATVQGQSLSGTWGADDLLINPSGGNVGIGYSDPKTRLQITAGVNLNAPSLGSATNAPLYVTNTDTTYGLLAGTNASDGHVWLQAQRTDGTATAYNLTLNEAGGNVGIGTTSPAVALDVQKAAASQIRAFETGSSVDLRLNAIGGAGLAGIIGTYSNHPVVVYANTTEAMRITSAGNVGIGTSSPSNLLEVRKDQDADTIVKVINAASAANATARYDLATYTANSYMILALKDNVASPYGQLSTGSAVTGIYYDCAQHVFRSQSGTTWFSILGSSGTLTSLPTYNNTATGSTVVVTSAGLIRRTSSSIKYKKDVENLDPAIATNAIDNLRPVWYRTKNAEGDDKATWSHIGLIAEEVDKVEPRLVRYRTDEVIDEQKPVLDEAGEPVLDEDGNETFTIEQVVRELAVPEPEDVDYARLSVLLLAEVKSLRERIAALEAK